MAGNPVDATQGSDGIWRYPQGFYWSDNSGYFSVNADGAFETGTTNLVPPVYQPIAVNVLNDQDFAAATFAGNLALDVATGKAANDIAFGLMPHQESGISLYNPVGGPFFRGGSSMTARPGTDVIINKQTGLIGTNKGIFLNTNPNDSFIQKYGGPFKVNQIPEGLTIQPAGNRPRHFELAPSESMTLERYQSLLDMVETIEHL